jgi:hypothetical protein
MIIVTTDSLIPGYPDPIKTRRLFQGQKLISSVYRYEFHMSEVLIFFDFLADSLQMRSLISVRMEKSHV